jgi:hypothetical protein
MNLSSNRALYEYLVSLESVLSTRGRPDLSRVAAAAARAANTIPATDFLGESRIALKRVLAEEGGIFSQVESADLQDVLRQLDEGF